MSDRNGTLKSQAPSWDIKFGTNTTGHVRKDRAFNPVEYRNKLHSLLIHMSLSVPGGGELLEVLESLEDESAVFTMMPSLGEIISLGYSENEIDVTRFLMLCALLYKNNCLLRNTVVCNSEEVLHGNSEDSILEIAVKLDAFEMIPELLKGLSGGSCSQADSNIISDVMLKAVQMGHLSTLRKFYECGFRPNICKASGKSVLHFAIESKADQSLEFLLTQNMDANLLDYKNCSPLVTAATTENIRAVDILLNHGVDLNTRNLRGRTALHIAADRGNIAIAEKLTHAGANIVALDEKNYSPLLMACAGGHKLVARCLLDRGANVNECIRYSPLHAAARGNHAKLVGMLLRRGADLSIRNVYGETALEWVVKFAPTSMTEFTDILDESIAFGEDVNDTQTFILNFGPLLFNNRSKETALLTSLTNLGHRDILNHPLCEAFVNMKWQKITNWIMYSFVAVYMFYIILLFMYVDNMVTIVHDMKKEGRGLGRSLGRDLGMNPCVNFNAEMDTGTPEKVHLNGTMHIDDLLAVRIFTASGTFTAEKDGFIPGARASRSEDFRRKSSFYNGIEMALLIVVYSFLLAECFQLVSDPFDYFKDCSNYLSLVNIVLTIILCSCVDPVSKTPVFTNHIAAAVVLLSSWEMMIVLAYIPAVGIYVQMFFKAVKNVLFFMLAFLVLVFGFGLALAVTFGSVQVGRFPFYLVTSYVMMVGELDYKGLFFDEAKVHEREASDPSPYTFSILLLGFLLVVVVTLTNLLVGLAVSDTQSIHDSALAYNAVTRIRRLHMIEQTLIFSRYLRLQRFKQRFFRRYLLFPDMKHRENFLVDTQDKRYSKLKLPDEICERLRKCKLNNASKLQRKLEDKALQDRQQETREVLKIVRELKTLLSSATTTGKAV